MTYNMNLEENVYEKPFQHYELNDPETYAAARCHANALYDATLAGEHMKLTREQMIAFWDQVSRFQSQDGMLRFIDVDGRELRSYERVDLWYQPTYAAVALGIHAYLRWPELFDEARTAVFSKLLEASLGRHFAGPGHSSCGGFVEVMRMFVRAGLGQFLKEAPEICPVFTKEIQQTFERVASDILCAREEKSSLTELDFQTCISSALSSLAQNFVLEKRLMASLVRDDFAALGLSEYGVEIHIDDLSKEEILDFIERENFNAIKYLKQDYFNFKKYMNAEFYPRHMDYLNNDCAPDLIRFMSIKIGGKKTGCYYNFLTGIGEEHLPVFTEEQVAFIGYLSGLLPLVRPHEFEIVRCLMNGISRIEELDRELSEKIPGYSKEQLEHALQFLKVVTTSNDELSLCIKLDDQLREYVDDLLTYGITHYYADNGEETGFKLWQNYRMDQVQLKLLKNPGYIAVGTYYYDDYVVIFASLKKDLPEADKLNYKDKFLQPDVFQWESMAHLPASDLDKLKASSYAHLFIRKVSSENGIVLPFTYVGKGTLHNCRKTESGNGTYLFDVAMEHSLPDYLQYDFGLTK